MKHFARDRLDVIPTEAEGSRVASLPRGNGNDIHVVAILFFLMTYHSFLYSRDRGLSAGVFTCKCGTVTEICF